MTLNLNEFSLLKIQSGAKKFVFVIFLSFIITVFSENTFLLASSSYTTNNASLISDSSDNSHGIKMMLHGMTRNNFMDVCAIQWLLSPRDSGIYTLQTLNLEKHITFREAEILIKELNKSEIVKCYTATLKSADNRPFYRLDIGNGEKRVIFVGGIHAREVANTQFLLKFAAQLINRYENRNQEIVQLLSDYTIIMLPCANPDGYSAAIEGHKAIYNPGLFFARFSDTELSKAKSNANGVDLNRNFPNYSSGITWNGNNRKNRFNEFVPSLNYFAGYSLGSENETKVIMNFIMNCVPFALRFIDFHSAGRLIYAGKPHLSDKFNALCEETGSIIRKHTGYTLLDIRHEVSGDGTDGTVTDFASEVAAGFVFNEKLGRLAPPENSSLIKKYNELKYPCSVNTVETLKTSRKEGF